MARRARLARWGGVLCAVWIVQLGLLARGAGPESTGAARLAPISTAEWTIERAEQLLARAGFGGSAADVQALYKLGPIEAVNRLVDYDRQNALDLPAPKASEKPDMGKDPAKLSPQERRDQNARLRREDQQRMADLRAWWIRRMAESPRPLEEKLTLFWHGLFTSGHQTVRSSLALYHQNELFRQHAAGNYGDLLHAVVHDPAMLRYLDNSSNVRGRPNENLARELLELFSMGEGNYSETDIKEGARSLTGYAFDRQAWTFRFTSRSHDTDDKTVFGQTGNWDGDKLVDLILEQPATARYIVRKLFVFFVHDNPDEATIESLAQTLRKNKYDLKPVLKTMFLSEEFYGPQSAGAHIKSPAELVVGMVRSLPIENINYPILVVALRGMGQDLFEPPNVKGWDGGRTWLSTNWLLARQNFAVGYLTGGGAGQLSAKFQLPAKFKVKRSALGKTKLDLVELATHEKLSTPGEIVDYLSQALLPTPLTDDQRTELIAALDDFPPHSDWSSRQAEVNARLLRLLALIVSMPQYQLS